MRTKVIVSTCLFFCLSFTFCLAQDVELRSQTDIDNFDSSITQILGNLIISDEALTTNPIIDLSNLANLTNVNGHVQISYNASLQNLNGLNNLATIGGSLNIELNNELIAIDGLVNLISIGEDVKISLNHSLLHVEGLSSLKMILGNLTLNGNGALSKIDGFSQIEQISGFVDIIQNQELVTSTGFNSLSSVGAHLIVGANAKLPDLNMFTSLTSVGNVVAVLENDALSNVDGLSNLNFLGGGLTVLNNFVLSNCCGIHHLIQYPHLVIGEVTIEGNSSGCDNESEIIQSICPGRRYLNGKILFDADNSGCDMADQLIPEFTLNLTQNGMPRTFTGHQDQQYFLSLADAQYVIVPSLPNTLFQFDPDTLYINLPADSNSLEHDFCVTVSQAFQDLSIDIIPIEVARPGIETDYLITYRNIGTQTISGEVMFEHPNDIVQLIATDPVISNQNMNILYWNYQDLRPFEKREIILTLRLNSPMDTPPLNGGEYLDFIANINPTANDVDLTNNTSSLQQLVVNSYDPNDKTCLIGAVLEPELVGSFIPYIIRFENVGTAAAIHVKIIDTIDTDVFDISSLKMTASSHEHTASVDGHVVTFNFEYINLPFEDDENDGFVAFKIKTHDDLVIGDELNNFADIYFDFNFPIRTNTAKVIVDMESATNKLQSYPEEIQIFPNPSHDEITIYTEYNYEKIQVFNALGHEVLTAQNASNDLKNKINISTLNDGLYFIRFTSPEGDHYTLRIVKS